MINDSEDDVQQVLAVELKDLFDDEIFLNVINRPDVETYIHYPHMDMWLTDKGYKVDSYGMLALASAIDYDIKMHPDETYFVTSNKELSSIANRFFGEDSILLI